MNFITTVQSKEDNSKRSTWFHLYQPELMHTCKLTVLMEQAFLFLFPSLGMTWFREAFNHMKILLFQNFSVPSPIYDNRGKKFKRIKSGILILSWSTAVKKTFSDIMKIDDDYTSFISQINEMLEKKCNTKLCTAIQLSSQKDLTHQVMPWSSASLVVTGWWIYQSTATEGVWWYYLIVPYFCTHVLKKS